jgi:cytochrome c biogenesis protein CcmG, thiol:disulfide interchange protein DsbE
MRRALVAAVAAVTMAGALAASARAERALQPWKGGDTPALTLPDLRGRTVNLRELKGRVVLVNFWATWCEPCREEMPSIGRLRERLAGKPFEVLLVNFGEGVPRIEEFLRRENLSLPVLRDADKVAASAWRAGGLPMTFLVDARGRVRYSVFGEKDWDEGEALTTVERLLAEAGNARR